MSDPETGVAPPDWQGGIGDVVVANADGTPLGVGALEGYVEYVGTIVDAFRDGEKKEAIAEMFNRAKLDVSMARGMVVHAACENAWESMKAEVEAKEKGIE